MAVLYWAMTIVGGVGFFASLTVHVCSYFSVALFDLDVAINVFHLGSIVVGGAAAILVHRLSAEYPRRQQIKAALRGCPVWLRNTTYAVFALAFVSFFATILLPLHERGSALHDWRMTSGHWMAFFMAGVAVSQSALRIAAEDPARRCPNGHLVGPPDQFCPTCGAALH